VNGPGLRRWGAGAQQAIPKMRRKATPEGSNGLVFSSPMLGREIHLIVSVDFVGLDAGFPRNGLNQCERAR